ncbi:hypothetical protein Bca4012_038790 [Brassica carinata]
MTFVVVEQRSPLLSAESRSVQRAALDYIIYIYIYSYISSLEDQGWDITGYF